MEKKKTIKEIRDDEIEKYSFQVPYNGTNEFYDKKKAAHFAAGWDACVKSQPQVHVAIGSLPATECPHCGIAPVMCKCCGEVL